MRRMQLIRAALVRVGDWVSMPSASFRVQHVYRGGGRLSFVTEAGYPVDVDPSIIVAVLR